ncbi:hypothetical protein ElyMa_004903800 [Elysia marginata]|uniref:Uncharacterized protein n=1 Tax=Elysia marginata TaxID=1093978 RepID=A0AAV4IVY2_9GAST|nr:hypothetical protein ElyMa_004903800 [Elysia marginata]
MIPIKVSWWRKNPRICLSQAWIAVQLGAHRNAPDRIRRKLTKAADWLEVNLELMANGSRCQCLQHGEDKENQSVSEIAQLYCDLQEEMVRIPKQTGKIWQGGMTQIQKFRAEGGY